MKRGLFAAALTVVAGCADAQAPAAPAANAPEPLTPPAPAACTVPRRLTFRVEDRIERQALGYTQGLQRRGDVLWESTGAPEGGTRLQRIDGQGRVTTLVDLGTTVFGEGLTILNDRVWQLTWRDRQVLLYDLSGRRVGSFANPRDGWGLTSDGRRLIATDGGDRLWFHDPADFRELGSVAVRLGERPVFNVNELEWVDGRIWGNVYETDAIVRIDPASGCVDAVADLALLHDLMSEEERTRLSADTGWVLNGIAHDAASGRFYLTGKNWRTIFIGRFEPAA